MRRGGESSMTRQPPPPPPDSDSDVESWDEDPVTLCDRDGLHFEAGLNAEGTLTISGQDLRPGLGWDEYEYAFSIPPEDMRLIRAALGGTPDDPVLELLAEANERIVPNVKSWLDAVGARYKFWSRIEPE